eukprot:2617297-Prymnesium_polylepis.1
MVWSPTSEQAAANQAGAASGKQVARTLGAVVGDITHGTIAAAAEAAALAENRGGSLVHVRPAVARREIFRILVNDI